MTKKRKRSKIFVLLLLPALVFIGFIGWCVCTLAESKSIKPKKGKAKKPNTSRDDMEFFVGVYEEEQREISR